MSLFCLRRLFGVGVAIAVFGGLAATMTARAPDRLVSRSRPSEPAGKSLAVGDTITTGSGERRRLLLPDRSVVCLRERSTMTVRSNDRVALTAGEAFFETASGKPAPTLKVVTPKREITARDCRFGVRITEDGTTVLVASGLARVAGIETPIRAGQSLAATGKKPEAAPRISHLVAWTRDLRNVTPLVPASKHAGGTLIARDPDGRESQLELRRCRIDVHIEDGFARTTIDQTYFNQTQNRAWRATVRIPFAA